MTETVIKRPMVTPQPAANQQDDAASTLRGELRAYALISVFVLAGWLVRDLHLVDPQQGTGYWLGIIGGSLMLSLLLYPLRKKVRFLHRLGSTRRWFRMHMILGLVGPLLVLYHCNFQIGSFNSRVALYCMLLVALSGIVGRHFYAAIHRGLYGRKLTLAELQKDLARSAEKSHGLATLMPRLVKRLDELCNELQGDKVTNSLGIGRSLKWLVSQPLIRLSLLWTARRELNLAAVRFEVVARDRKRLKRTTSRFVGDYTRLMTRVAKFTVYERLFAIWHLLHLPIFFVMVLSALVHVLAVHMY
jgi:hypothetical protein